MINIHTENILIYRLNETKLDVCLDDKVNGTEIKKERNKERKSLKNK